MYFDQLGHLGDKPRFRMQPPQDLLCRCGASLLVPLKVPDPLLIGGAAAGLFHIVQQGGPAQRRLRRNILQHRQGVLPNIFPVVGVILHKAHHRQQLRQHHPNDINILPQHRGGHRAAQQPFQLGPYPLRGKIFQPWGVPAQGVSRSRLDLKPQCGGKPQSPQNAQSILGKAAVWFPHRPDEPVFQVCLPAKGIDDLAGFGIPGHRTYGKIPPGQVLLQPHPKGDGIGVAAIGIAPLPPEGRQLHRGFPGQHCYGPVPHPGFYHPAAAQQGLRLLRPGRGSHIPVMGLLSQ